MKMANSRQQTAVSRAGTALAVAAVLVLGATREALAATADCAQITNFASATFQTTAQVGSFGSTLITYAVTANVMAASPDMSIGKVATPTIQGSGGIVTFCIRFQNTSYCASAFNVTLVDRTPDGMNYVGSSMSTWPPAVSWNPEYALPASPNTWNSGQPTGVALYYLRWWAPILNPRQSGVVCFNVSVL